MTDADLARFAGCKALIKANLGPSAATDAGLAHLKGCPGLRQTVVDGTKVTARGLAQGASPA